jgi:hypothetical protein
MEDNGEYEVDEVYKKRITTFDGTITNKWILDIYECQSLVIYLKPWAPRRIQSIIPVVYNKVPEGSIIYTDSLNVYNGRSDISINQSIVVPVSIKVMKLIQY